MRESGRASVVMTPPGLQLQETGGSRSIETQGGEPLRRGHARWTHLAIGVLLSFGAPLGALLIRFHGMADLDIELRVHGFFYAYQLIGTMIVFGLAGFFTGLHADHLENERDRLFTLAQRDGLTGLPNERAFWEQYRRNVEMTRRYGTPLSLLVIDVDELKRVNDEEGHSTGSAALKHVARLILDEKRDADIAARWGGDEFGVLMPGASEPAAIRLAEQIIEATRRRPLRFDRKERSVTVTIGVATISTSTHTDGLFDRADRALYAGKQNGRNQFKVDGTG